MSAGNFSFSERIIGKYAGAAAMYFVSKKLKKKHNITDERAALYEAAETWVDALKGRQFLGLFILLFDSGEDYVCCLIRTSNYVLILSYNRGIKS